MLLASWFAPQASGLGRFFTILLVGFFTISAVLISFGNWMERHTSLMLSDTGIEFLNGVRRIQIGWKEITEVRIHPSGKGSKVVVYGEQGYISFQTLVEVASDGIVKERFGFEKGEEILEMILHRANLVDAKKRHIDQYDYYLRE
jgi:hypothetical protein